MRYEESNLQIGCVDWFRKQYPKYARLLWAIPNGGARNAKTGMWLKKEGVVAGASDLVLFIANSQYHSLHIELKTRIGRQQESQAIMQTLLEQQNNKYIICRSFEEFRNEILKYLRG